MISPEQQKRVDELCRMISAEKDHAKIAELARELNELLVEKNPPGVPTSSPKVP
jgi:hypothetical protein